MEKLDDPEEESETESSNPTAETSEVDVIGESNKLKGGGAGERGRVVEPAVAEALNRLETNQGVLCGEIIDVASFNMSSPYNNFNFPRDRVIGESQQRIQKIIDEETYTDCILIAVSLNTYQKKDVFVHPFTYESSNNDTHEPIIDLSATLNIDMSMIHHLVGETVEVRRFGNKWEISNHKEYEREPTVSERSFAIPLLISTLPIPLSIVVGLQTSTSSLLSLSVGGAVSVLLGFILTWLYASVKLDHPLPGFLGRMLRPQYMEDENKIVTDDVVDVKHVEVDKIITLADTEENRTNRTILHNLAVTGYVPEVGRTVVPLPCPAEMWYESTGKHAIYRLAPTVGDLEHSRGELLPVNLDEDNRIQIDADRIHMEEPQQQGYWVESFADSYVQKVNAIFRTGSRTDVYINQST